MVIHSRRRCLAFAPLFLMLVTTAGLPVQAAIGVTFEKVVRTGDPVPGRDILGVVFNGRARQPSDNPGVLSIPTINDSDEVAFMARSSQSNDFNKDATIGIYAKSPGSPLRVLADTGADAMGNPVFAVPGQPAGTFFSSFDPPLINNRGDVVFRAVFGGGAGFYATTTMGGTLVKIVDSTDAVPGVPGVTFNGFFFAGFNPRILIWLNDMGKVVFMGRFRIPTQQFEDQGLYGTTVAGGVFYRLVDTTETVIPTNETVPFRGLSQTNFPAINNNGDVIFQGGIGAPPPATLLDGVFLVPVDGSAAPTTIARRGQLSPTLSDGNLRAFFSTWAGQDINDAGDFLIAHNFFRSGGMTPQALFTGNVANPTAPLTPVVDNVGGFAVPGQPTGTTFTGAAIAAINGTGQMGFLARDNGPISNAQGIYAASLTGPPFTAVSHNGDVPPGQVAPASISDFQGTSAPINATGNMVLDPTAINPSITDALFGLYFYNTCTQTLERIVDRDISVPPLPTGLGATFGPAALGLQRFVRVRDGQEVRAGQFRAINNNDNVAFLAAFSTFDVGIYIARVNAGGGALAIVCPADALLLTCPADTSPAALGAATASGCGTFTVGSTDVITAGCGNTEVITRTWTADDGTGNIVSCVQTITTQDTTTPGLTIPADSTIECNEPTDPSHTGQASATDTCDSAPAFTFTDAVTPGTCGQASVITRTWTATDACGNSTSADQIITIRDTTPPSLTIPGNVTVECGTSTTPAATGQAAATDNCDAATVVAFQDTVAGGTCPQGSVITRTWTASDACGNSTSADQTISVVDTTAAVISCPNTISTSGGFGGALVTFSPTAVDACDPSPSITSTPPSGSFFTTGLTSVSAAAADTCANTSACGFDVLVSCFGVNRAKIGIKDSSCRGVESIELRSYDGTEELISLFKAEDGQGGGVEEDVLPPSVIANDGVNGPVTINTSCAQPIAIGDVFGPYTVVDIKQDFDDSPGSRGNKVELRGSFVPAVPFDLSLDGVTFTIDDGAGHSAVFIIPAGSFQLDGKPEKKKFKFEGVIGGSRVEAKFENCEFKFEAKDANNTAQLVGTTLTVRLEVGQNVGQDTLAMEDKGNHLKFKRQPKVECCPKCEGLASLQVTSNQKVLVFTPGAGQTKLPANTVVDDGVNGAVTIHTSCSQAINVGDVFGPYTVSEVVKIFDGSSLP